MAGMVRILHATVSRDSSFAHAPFAGREDDFCSWCKWWMSSARGPWKSSAIVRTSGCSRPESFALLFQSEKAQAACADLRRCLSEEARSTDKTQFARLQVNAQKRPPLTLHKSSVMELHSIHWSMPAACRLCILTVQTADDCKRTYSGSSAVPLATWPFVWSPAMSDVLLAGPCRHRHVVCGLQNELCTAMRRMFGGRC